MSMTDQKASRLTGSPAASLSRLLIAAALFPLLFWAVPGAGTAAFVGAALALILGGMILAGHPRAVLRDPLVRVMLDLLVVGLLVAGTGGGGSPFFALYFLAALGLAGIANRARTALAAVATLGGYPAAVALADGLGAVLTVPVGLRVGILAIFCAVVVHLGARNRYLAGRESALTSELGVERDRAARAEGLIPGFAAALRVLGLEEILYLTVRMAHAGCGGTYAHVALPEGNHHSSFFSGNSDACPSWWHPSIQGLVLHVRREGRAVRVEEEVHGIKGFMAVPLGQEGDSRGVLIVGGGEFGPEVEGVLNLISEAAAPALEGAREAPGGRDPVTDLPNRASLYRVLRRELSYGRSLTVFAAEVGNLDRYNSSHGFAAGNDLLRRIGERLGGGRRAFMSGGNGFVVVMSGIDEARIRRTALAIERTISEEGGDLVRPIVGYAHTGEGRDDPDLLLRAALDAAGRGTGGHARGIVEALLGALEAKDPGIGEHLRGVSGISQDIALGMGFSAEQTEHLVTGALLHDVGKIGIPDQILHKPGRLTEEEYRIIMRHPALGAGVISPVDELAPVLPVVRHHHERFDGEGYPDGLGGKDIPLAARIVAVADTFDTMVRGRPYGYGVSREVALREIEANAGTQFDPGVVRMLRMVLSDAQDNRTGSSG